jgi:hypothetical protein
MIGAQTIVLFNELDILSVFKTHVYTESGNSLYRLTILYKFGKIIQEINVDTPYEQRRDTEYNTIVKHLQKLNKSVSSE